MAKRRTSGVQRRQRASTQALNRRLDAPRGATGLDWRILAIGGFLLVGMVVLVAVVLASAGPNPNAGVAQADAGRGHIPDCTAGDYSSVPATSGCHEGAPAEWGIYTIAQRETQLIHNLEHGGIVIWYQPDQLTAEQIAQLETYVGSEVRGQRFKVIVTPWDGEDFGHPIAVTAWQFLLYLDAVDLDAVRGFTDAHYGDAPEPNGGPAAPAT